MSLSTLLIVVQIAGLVALVVTVAFFAFALTSVEGGVILFNDKRNPHQEPRKRSTIRALQVGWVALCLVGVLRLVLWLY